MRSLQGLVENAGLLRAALGNNFKSSIRLAQALMSYRRDKFSCFKTTAYTQHFSIQKLISHIEKNCGNATSIAFQIMKSNFRIAKD
ncbi:hypothetical protein [Acidovorax sp. A79]|uniref:hypothetical protein n=1 Tax=Acidovorax sp. A79 TaxID=3056107 RepID=UPI0034E8B5AD